MEKTGYENIIYKAVCRFWVFVFFIVILSKYDKCIVYAGTHTHTNSVCYDVSPHAHGSSCYKEITETCGGTWVKSEVKSYVAKNWYGATCSSCGRSVEGNQTTKNCSCGTKVKLSFVGCDIRGYVLWKCNSCGQEKKGTIYECYAACDKTEKPGVLKEVKEEVDYEYGTEYAGERHVSEVKKNVLTCKKQVGEYYDASGQKASYICGKIVTKIIPNAEIQSLKPGEKVNTLVTLYMYNGDIVTGYECEVVGFDTEKFDGEYQNVILKVNSNDYKYKYDVTENKRTESEIYTGIKVMLINNFELTVDTGVGGEIYYTVNGNAGNGKINTGDKIVVNIKPDIGYSVKNFVLKKDTEEIKIISDGEISGYTGENAGENTGKNEGVNIGENAGENTSGNASEDTDKAACGAGSTVTVNPDKSITYEFDCPECNVNLYADFALKSVKVVFDPCGGDINGSSDNIEKITNYGKKLGEAFEFPETPVLAGYIFLGWYDEEGNGYAENSVWTREDTLYLYAEWGAKDKNTIIVKYDDEIPVPGHKNILGFTENAQDFWRYSEYKGNGTGETLIAGTILKTLKDMYFYGHWEAKEYKIYFDAGEGDIAENEKTKIVRYHTKIGDLPCPVFEKHIFCGWKISSDKGENTEKQDENSRDNKNNKENQKNDFINPEDIYLYTSDITLYAVWQNETGEKKAVIDAGIYAINNIPGEYDEICENGNVFADTKAGDRISFYVSGQFSESVKLPVQIKITPIYEIINEENTYEQVHVLSNGVLKENLDGNEKGKIRMFYERGQDTKDFFMISGQEKYISVNLHYVLNHLSYAVREENYESMKEYSSINTLSGYEEFFEKKVTIRISFDLEIVDDENDVIFDDVIFAFNSKMR